MDDKELLDIAARLKLETSISNARSQLFDGKPWMFLLANRDALLHIASVCLTAATTSVSEETGRSLPCELEHRQTTNEAGGHRIIGSIQRLDMFPTNSEQLAEYVSPSRRQDRMALFGCAIICIGVFAVVASACMFWWHVITGEPIR